jgi:hypothetical protein
MQGDILDEKWQYFVSMLSGELSNVISNLADQASKWDDEGRWAYLILLIYACQ